MAGLLRSRVVVAVLAALFGMTAMLVVDAGAHGKGHANHSGVVYSGCFHHGRITKVRIRDTKPERCETIETDSVAGHARYVTWSASGPEGPAGLDGDAHFTPFYVALDPADGETDSKVVLQHGPFTVRVRCRNNIGGEDAAELVVRGSEDEWYAPGSPPLPAGFVVVGGDETEPDGTDKFDNDIDDFVVASASGHVLGWDGESTAFGLNVFGHGCIVAGNIWTTTGTP